MSENESRDIDDYTSHYLVENYEDIEVKYRRKKVLQELRANSHGTILEIGCGMEPIFSYLEESEYERMVIVEPSDAFVENAKKLKNEKVDIIKGLFGSEAVDLSGYNFDFIICTSLLHEIPDADSFMKSIYDCCNDDTVVFLNVPNANSMHRVLGKAAGFIKDEHELTERNITYQQARVYDLDALERVSKDAGFSVIKSESFMLKPFTHGQMYDMVKKEILNDAILDGFYNMCEGQYSDLGAEIYVELKKNALGEKKLEARVVTFQEYKQAARNVKNVFNRAEFLELNKEKVKNLLYIIVYKESSPRFAAYAGVKENGVAKMPFSAPFGYIEPLKKEQNIADYYEALAAIEKCLKENGVKEMHITLPPNFYDKYSIDCWIGALINNNWKIDYVETSFGLHIAEIAADYDKHIRYNAKKNLNIALKHDMALRECHTEEEKKHAYDIIKTNRMSKGYYISMTEEQVMETIKVVSTRMFVCSCDGEDVAAALIYDVTDKAAQVVYWGDLPGVQDKKVINWLCYALIKEYVANGYDYLDIGSADIDGHPNWGLCDFKDGIGCERTAKFLLYKKF